MHDKSVQNRPAKVGVSMKQLQAALLGGVLLLATQAGWSAPVSGLYQVREPLVQSADDDRADAFSRAFVTLMQRLTGTADSAKSSALAAHLANPRDLALGYTFQEDELQVSFDPTGVMQVLRDAQVPVWGNDRPVLLLWWLQDGLQGRQLLGDGQNRSLNLQQAALHRGLPARFPLADLSEQVRADQGWSSADERQLQELLQRYGGDALLVVETRDETSGVSGSWQLLGSKLELKGSLAGENAIAAADELFQQLAREMAREYAVVPGQGEQLQVRLQGLDLDAMLDAEKALQVFDGQLLALQGDEAVWLVTALPEQLRSQLALYQFRELTLGAFDDGDEALDTPEELLFAR